MKRYDDINENEKEFPIYSIPNIGNFSQTINSIHQPFIIIHFSIN